jgi:hypothetical protein
MFKRNRTSELIVKPAYSPRFKLTVIGIIATIVAGAAWGIYTYGLTTAGFDILSASRKQGDLKRSINKLVDENQELRESLARAQRSLQMDQVAYQELDDSLKKSAREIVKLKEEIGFYRAILSPDNKAAGLHIQSMKVEPVNNPGIYRYKLVVIQALKHDRNIYGNAEFEVRGLQGGAQKVLRFPEANKRQISVNFKYYQDIEGEFNIPLNFTPNTVTVKVVSRGQGAKTVEKEYPWPRRES